MNNRIRSAIAATVAGATLLTGAALAPGAAEAKVTSRNYTFKSMSYGIFPSEAPATVRGNTLYVYAVAGKQTYPIHQTRSGGYYDAFGVRYILNKQRGGGYAGPMYWNGIVVGDSKLIPRR